MCGANLLGAGVDCAVEIVLVTLVKHCEGTVFKQIGPGVPAVPAV